MEEDRFDIIFKKLKEVVDEDAQSIADFSREVEAESEEISELRKLTVALTEPPPQTYTIS